MSRWFLSVTLILFIGSFTTSLSQDRCATVQYEKMRSLQQPGRENIQQFEDWMKQKKNQRDLLNQRTTETQSTYTIPVVVHIIHNGEPLGSGSNISDAQVQSQIDVLNKDFKRLNLDASNTPTEFATLAGSIDINFVLAKQDPIGAPSNGIVRVKGTQSSWTLSENGIFKSLSYWPAENYLNIWVVNFSDSNIGYAQFPISSLSGLENSPDDRLTDGIAISYTTFGSADGGGSFILNSKYNKGRTATHEIGHFFGLRHIWGDDGSSCSGTDYVDDTPNQAGSYINQCPTGSKNSCSSNDMYMNYMDYTNDACMNIFTVGQVGRMNVVIQNSPRRSSLLTSPGATAPTPASLDVAIRKINTPGNSLCGNAITPTIQVQNLGSSTVTTLKVQFKVGNTVIETKDFTATLSYLQTTDLAFSPYTPTLTSQTFNFEILQVNGAPDARTANDKLSVTSTLPSVITLPVSETFASLPAKWTVYNPDNQKTWQITTTSSGQSVLYVNSFDYDNIGAIDRLQTPVIDLTNVSSAFLKFDRAYAPYGNDYVEQLRVLASDACDFNSSTLELFNKGGSELATAAATTDFFSPTATQWKTEIISLSQFIGKRIQLAFESANGYGNNQYLDNISIISDLFVDLTLASLESPSPVICTQAIQPKLKIKNAGTSTVNNFKVNIVINNQTPQVQTISNLNFQPGDEQIFTLNSINISDGANDIKLTIQDPNGLTDAKTADNEIVSKIFVNKSTDLIPLRQNFNKSFTDSWVLANTNPSVTWSPSSTNFETSIVLNGFDNSNIGKQAWMVSPSLDFSRVEKASLIFDVSYASRFSGNDQLQLLYSTDCGLSFNNVLFNASGESLASTTSNSSWKPIIKEEWVSQYINLNGLVGQSNLRFAFVGTNNNGNNLYLDNIEFYIDDNPDPIKIADSFAVYGVLNDVRATFNLTERQLVNLQIYNATGEIVLDNQLPETLNQTYYFDLGHLSTGIYIARIQIGNRFLAQRIVLANSK